MIYRFEMVDSKAANARRVDAPDSDALPVAAEVTRLHPSSRLSHVRHVRNIRPSHENLTA